MTEQIDEGLRSELQRQGIWVSSMQELYNWGRQNSIWPLQFGLACCAIEMIATAASRYDIARFGGEVFRPSPRQADLMIVAGTVTKKMAPQIVRLFNQMADPKYVIAMGACAISGGPFKQGYNVLKGIDRYIPVRKDIATTAGAVGLFRQSLFTLRTRVCDAPSGWQPYTRNSTSAPILKKSEKPWTAK